MKSAIPYSKWFPPRLIGIVPNLVGPHLPQLRPTLIIMGSCSGSEVPWVHITDTVTPHACGDGRGDEGAYWQQVQMLTIYLIKCLKEVNLQA
jgi:hypothetical protein